jgi:hypothetical protein
MGKGGFPVSDRTANISILCRRVWRGQQAWGIRPSPVRGCRKNPSGIPGIPHFCSHFPRHLAILQPILRGFRHQSSGYISQGLNGCKVRGTGKDASDLTSPFFGIKSILIPYPDFNPIPSKELPLCRRTRELRMPEFVPNLRSPGPLQSANRSNGSFFNNCVKPRQY